jgi:hypothetical protein
MEKLHGQAHGKVSQYNVTTGQLKGARVDWKRIDPVSALKIWNEHKDGQEGD